MAISAIASQTRTASISTASLRSASETALLGAKASSISLYRSKCLLGQRRTFFGWGRCRGSSRHPHSDARYKRAMEKSDRMFSPQFRPYGRKSEWYRSPFQYDDGKRSTDWKRLKRSRGADWEDVGFQGKWADSWFARHDAEWNRMEEEFHKLKKAIDEDPYGMVFGRRLHPFPFGQRKAHWSTLFHDVLGFDGSGSRPESVKPAQTVRARSSKTETQEDKSPSPESGSRHDNSGSASPNEEQIPVKKAKATETQTPPDAQNPPSTGQEVLFQFDPISGRMVPKPPQASMQESEMNGSKSPSDIGKPVTASHANEMLGEELKSDTLVFTGAPREKHSARVGEEKEPKINEAKPGSVEPKEKPSSKPDPQTEELRKPSETSSWTHTPKVILGDIKDYITSKLDAEPETPDTRGWPYLMRRKSDAKISMHDAPLASTNYRKDPEAEELEALRLKDVRAAFKHRELEREKVEQQTSPSEQQEDVVEEPVRLDEPLIYGSGMYGSGNANAASGLTSGQPTSDDVPGRKEKDGESKPIAENKSGGAAILSTDWGPVLEEQMRQIYEQTQTKASSSTPESEKAASPDRAEQVKPQVAAISTDNLSVDAIEAIAQVASANKASKSLAVADKPVLIEAQHDQIDKLLMDIERANDAAATLMEEIKKGIQNQRVSGEQLETKAEPTLKTDATRPSYYKVLAYDVLTREVKGTSMASGSSVPFEPIHPADALSRLDYPAKFLPYISRMEAEGYELFSGGREVLVFKKMREGTPTASGTGQSKDTLHSPSAAAQLEQEAIDEMESAKSGSKPPPLFSPSPDPHSSPNAASVSPTSPASESSSASDRIKTKDKGSHPIRKAVKRMFLAGVVTGGTFYAIGVVVEYFKTGGQDGLGPRGFTGLEGR